MSGSVAKDIAQLLNDNAIATLGSNLFAFQWGSDTQDEQVLVLDSGGLDTNDKSQNERPNFQILVRGDKNVSPSLAYDLARSVHVFLIQLTPNITIGSTEYLGFEPMSTLSPLGEDENSRFIYSSNYTTYRNPD